MLNTVTLEEGIGIVTLMLIALWSFLTLGVDIAAIVIAFKKHMTCHGEIAHVSPKTLLIVGGLANIGATLILFLMICLLIARSRGEAGLVHVAPFILATRALSWFIFAWAVIGFVMYANVSSDCQKTSMGRTIISWAVIKSVTAMVQMLASQTSIEDTRPEETRVEERRVEERRSVAQQQQQVNA